MKSHEVQWRQLTLGHLSRNKFWGEDPNTQYHSVVASSTLVQDGEIRILVDPTLPVEQMEERLRRCCGLNRNDIDIVFATHFHTDHRVDAEKYPNAKLYMSEASVRDVEKLKEEGGVFARLFLNGAVFDFQAAPERISPGVTVCPLPGHTPGLAGLLFTSGGRRVLLSGDTIMNTEYYHAREGYFIDASQEKTAASMEWARENADLIVPGHGDWFFTDEKSENIGKLTWRKLNLCADGEEPVVLVQTERENIVINPTLRGDLLREAIYDARGLEPSDITRVICLKNDPQHMLDVRVLSNARRYLPEDEMKAGKNSPQEMCAEVWKSTPEMPIELVKTETGIVCLFESGGRRIAVASDRCDSGLPEKLKVDVLIEKGQIQVIR